MNDGQRDFLIVGGGIVGLSTAYKLLLARPGASVAVVEKEPGVGMHQSSHNSGVLHAGLEYAPGSAKAALATSGIRQMTQFCTHYGVPFEICGKLVIAVREGDVLRLQQLMRRGVRNGLRRLRWVAPDEMRDIEPHANGRAGIWVGDEGIVDYGAVCTTLARLIVEKGGRILTGARVRALRREPTRWTAVTEAGDVAGRVLVNCAGLHSDRVARLAGEEPGLVIVPFRGQYYRLRPERTGLVRHLIYPVPDPAFPFLGVHFTRVIGQGGGVHAGPTAALAPAREGYRWRDVRARDLGEALVFPGLWRFLARHPGAALAELQRSVSRRAVTRALQQLVPELAADDLLPGGAGVRAQAMLPDGRLAGDFVFLTRSAAVHVLNAPSPGATAALAIGDDIARRALAAGEPARPFIGARYA